MFKVDKEGNFDSNFLKKQDLKKVSIHKTGNFSSASLPKFCLFNFLAELNHFFQFPIHFLSLITHTKVAKVVLSWEPVFNMATFGYHIEG